MKTIKILFIYSSKIEGGKSCSEILNELSDTQFNFLINYSDELPSTEQIIWADIIYSNSKMFLEHEAVIKKLIIDNNAILVVKTKSAFYEKVKDCGVKNILLVVDKNFIEQDLCDFVVNKYLLSEKTGLAGFN